MSIEKISIPNSRRNSGFLILFFLLAGMFFTWLALASNTFAGGQDSVAHYLIARYAIEHPENLLDLWGKPIYTLLSLPFARFGFFGSQLFNILAALLSALLVLKTAKLLNLGYAFTAVILLLCAPEYFYDIPSSITEISFGLVLMLACYLLFKGKSMLAALVISFLPFARSEGYMLLLMFALALIALKEWKALPLVFAGSLLYSLAGWLVYNDFFWLLTRHPYKNTDIYGSGSFWHYVEFARTIWGTPLFCLILLGTIFFIVRSFRVILKREKADKVYFILLFVVFGSFYAYLFGHSYVWWKGLSASYGLTRVMSATMPLGAIIGLYGLWQLIDLFNPRLRILRNFIVFLLILLVLKNLIDVYPSLPFTGAKEEPEMLKAGEWYVKSPYYPAPKVYYSAPTLAMAFEVDPFSWERGYLENVERELEIMPEGSLVVWDAHFGPNESQLPLDVLLSFPELEIVGHFVPDPPFTTVNNYNYEIYIFRKREQETGEK